MSLEYCINCDDETGRAGKGDDSLYISDKGPYCQTCFDYEARITDLTQQLADSALSHTEKDEAIKSLTDSNLELEQENAEWKRSHDEHNALLQKLEWSVDIPCGAVSSYRGCYFCRRMAFDDGTTRHAPDCRLAAHLKIGDTDGR